jgi:hypothetical protein
LRSLSNPTQPETFVSIVAIKAGSPDLACCYRFDQQGLLAGITSNANPHDANRAAAQRREGAILLAAAPPCRCEGAT